MKYYTTMELSKELNLSSNFIIHAVMTGVIQPIKDAKGRGSSRKYSENNMKQFKVMKILMSSKIPLREIANILHKWDDTDELLSKAEKLYKLFCEITKRNELKKEH